MKNTKETLFEWAKYNRKKLACNFFSQKTLLPSDEKTVIFMAGSPGAGKTEFINRLLTKDQQSAYYVLDLDIVRKWMPGYEGNYVEKYTRGAIKILEILFDECVSNNYNFILDGTFTSTDIIDRNINRLIEKGYNIEIFYIHTQPYMAWIFTLLRGSDDNRRIPLMQFINYYHLAKENIGLVLEKFDNKIKLNVVQKIRDKNNNIKLEENIYNPINKAELDNIFDKNIAFHYNLGKDGIFGNFFFYSTKFISLIPFIGKFLLRHIAKIPK